MRTLTDKNFSADHYAQESDRAANKNIAEEMGADHNSADCNNTGPDD